MDFTVMECPRQPDGISCGVFVCFFMEKIAGN